MNRDEPVITLDRMCLDVDTGEGSVRLLDDIDLSLLPGRATALVGESGSGKSMTLRCISRLLPAGARTSGTVRVGGADVAALSARQLRQLRRTTIGTVFQDPRSAINPIQRIGDFMLEAIRDAGGDLTHGRARAVELLRRMGISDAERRMGQYPFELSGGLLQRVMIASVLLAGPDVMLADEPTTALDVTTQSDVLALTEELRRDRGMAMLFVTHDLDLALALCDEVMVMYAGRVLETGSADTIRDDPRHPYTIGLLGSRPPIGRRLDRLPVIEGAPRSAADTAAGCPFADRCAHVMDACRTTMPPSRQHETGWVRCHLERSWEFAEEGGRDD